MSVAPPSGPFSGRTIQLVRDLSIDEQYYLYETTRRLKQAVVSGDDTSAFRINDDAVGVYLLFFEDSTRTKESFRNAAKFHRTKVNDFDAKSSSLQKKESISDTVRMLFGYSETSIFVVRTQQEGVCRWLEEALGNYAERAGLAAPGIINGGDGRHEHPTQEFLDEFSFLEHMNWDRSHVHVALVGDLFHGRTVHSKVDGLKVFGEVRVDLVAPEDIGMPSHYKERMRESGFAVREFASIDEYLAAGDHASIWYFTRLQLERMGERLLDRAPALRHDVTFRRDHLEHLHEGTEFFHPLPRHQETPTIPYFLDTLPVNGWDRQSMNGYFTRIVQIGMLGGRLGTDFAGASPVEPTINKDFVVAAPIEPKPKPDYKIGIKPVETGIVIDHIGKGRAASKIWDHIDKIRRTLGLDRIGSHGVFASGDTELLKGIISLPGVGEFDRRKLKMLAAIAPGCTLNTVKDHQVVEKFRMHMPPRVYNLEEISCKNEDCISHPRHHEGVSPDFYRSAETTFICRYCERPHRYREIW